MIHERAGVLRLEGEAHRLALRRGPERLLGIELRGVKVHRVRNVGVVGQRELDRVADPAVHERAGNVALERPARDHGIVGNPHRSFARVPIDLNPAARRRRRKRRIHAMIRHVLRALRRRTGGRRSRAMLALQHRRIQSAVGVVRLMRSARRRTLPAYALGRIRMPLVARRAGDERRAGRGNRERQHRRACQERAAVGGCTLQQRQRGFAHRRTPEPTGWDTGGADDKRPARAMPSRSR